MDFIQFAPDPAIRIEQRYGSYVIEKPLGCGASAMVLLGKHLYLDTLAAIKIPREQSGSPGGLLFNQEAYLASRLVHPSIVRILDYGVQSGREYLAMDYAPEGTLSQLRGMALPLELVVDYAGQIASGLDYLRARGIIHCDIKPSNLLIGRDERILISDFGIALLAGNAVARPDGIIRGTPLYMAPEQIMGNPCFASDQYALALVLYELLCGVPPFGETRLDVVQHHLCSEPPTLRERGIFLSPAVEGVIARALAKDPRARYQSAGHFALVLRQAARASSSTPAVATRKHEPPVLPTVTAKPLAARKYTPHVERKAGRWSPLGAVCSGALLAASLIWLFSLLRYSNAQIEAALLACGLICCLFAAAITYRKTALLVSCIAVLALLCGLVFHSELAFVATVMLLLLPSIVIAVSLRMRTATRKSIG